MTQPLRDYLSGRISVLRRWLAGLLHPETQRRAQGYRRILGQLDEARWWLGKTHPIPASLAQHILDCENSYNRNYLEEIPRDPSWTWQPPAWVGDISTYRGWLDNSPFGSPTADLEEEVQQLISRIDDMGSELEDAQGMVKILTRANQDLGLIKGSWTDVRQIEAEAEIARLRARLEIDTATNGAGETIPHQPGWPDGISCRDETIQGLDNKVARLTTQRDEMEARIRELSAECEEVKNKLWLHGGPALT